MNNAVSIILFFMSLSYSFPDTISFSDKDKIYKLYKGEVVRIASDSAYLLSERNYGIFERYKKSQAACFALDSSYQKSIGDYLDKGKYDSLSIFELKNNTSDILAKSREYSSSVALSIGKLDSNQREASKKIDASLEELRSARKSLFKINYLSWGLAASAFALGFLVSFVINK